MKNYLLCSKKTLSIFLFILIVLSIALSTIGYITNAEQMPINPAQEDKDTNVQYSSKVKEAVNDMQTELLNNDTSIEKELNRQKMHYESLLSNANNQEEIDKIANIITATDNILIKYKSEIVKSKQRAAYHCIYTPAIECALAWFNMKDYFLSAELLTHAKSIDVSDVYQPINYDVIRDSSLAFSISDDTKLQGSGTFEQGQGTREECDLYYSIHSFDFSKVNANSRNVTIIDKYDFAKVEDSAYAASWSKIKQNCLQIMYEAQVAKALIVYDIRVTVNPTIKWKYPLAQRPIYLGPNQTQLVEISTPSDITIKLYTQGNMDTVICFFDSYVAYMTYCATNLKEYCIKYDDDSGDGNNAYIEMKIVAGNTYYCLLKYYGASSYGTTTLRYMIR